MAARAETKYRSRACKRTSFRGRPCSTEFSHSLGSKQPCGDAARVSWASEALIDAPVPLLPVDSLVVLRRGIPEPDIHDFLVTLDRATQLEGIEV